MEANAQPEGGNHETPVEQRLEEALADNARLWQEVNRLRAERREVDYHERLAGQLTSSLSWRVTSPLRSGKDFARRARRRLEERRG